MIALVNFGRSFFSSAAKKCSVDKELNQFTFNFFISFVRKLLNVSCAYPSALTTVKSNLSGHALIINRQPLHNVSPQLIHFIAKIKTTQKNFYLFPSLGHFWGRMVVIWRFQMRRKYLPNQISCWDFRIFFKLDKSSCSSVGFILIDIIFIQEGEIIFFVFHSSHWLDKRYFPLHSLTKRPWK